MTVTGGRLDIVIHASRPTPAGFSQSKLIRPREVVLPQLASAAAFPDPCPGRCPEDAVDRRVRLSYEGPSSRKPTFMVTWKWPTCPSSM